MKLINAKVVGAFHITRGTVLNIHCPAVVERDNMEEFKRIVGDTIEYQGVQYPIKGIESWRVMRPLQIDEPIGLLV